MCDPRVKVLLLFAYTVTLFFIDTWLGQALFALAFFAAVGASRVSVSRYASMGVPVYALAAFTVLFAAINANVGFAAGFFYGIRMILLVMACLVVSFTTTSTELTDALRSFMGPLRLVRVPVDDVATVCSLAIRFIPLSAQELCLAHDAQLSRGARFSGAGLLCSLSAWGSVFVSLFVNLFRRADKLSVAMEARCYGMPGVRRSSLSRRSISARSWVALFFGVASMGAIAAFL